MEPYTLNQNIDSIIKTLESMNELKGKGEYSLDKETFQNLGYFGRSTIYDGVPIQKGLEILQNKINNLSDKVIDAEPGELYYLSKKIDQIFELILKGNKTLLDSVIFSYGKKDDGQVLAITLQINELAKTSAKSLNSIYKTLKLSDLAKPFPESLKGLPDEIWLKIFSEEGFKELKKKSMVDKKWNELANNPMMTKKMIFDEVSFNPSHLNTFCGMDTVSPEEIAKAYELLPDNINEILKSNCPAFQSKKIIETHILFYIPEFINGEPVTVDNLGLLLKELPEFSNNATGFASISDEIVAEISSTPIKSGWVLMITDVIPNSTFSSHTQQKKLVKNLNKNEQMDYKIPLLGEGVFCFAAEYLRSKKRLFNQGTNFMFCQEKILGDYLYLHATSYKGLTIDCNNSYIEYLLPNPSGIYAARRFDSENS